jgi:hypothetical protein
MCPRLCPLAALVLACAFGPQGDPPRPSDAIAAGRSAHSAGAASLEPDSVVGCYRASRPLGSAASPTGGMPTPGLDTFKLVPDGLVERPHVGTPAGYSEGMAASHRASWQRGSGWTVTGDSLHVRLSNGFSGWNIRLVRERPPNQETFKGIAHYLSDVVVVDGDWRPPAVAVRVQRENCTDLDPPA